MNPDSSPTTEEAEGAREVLEVRLWNWGVGGERGVKGPVELGALCSTV